MLRWLVLSLVLVSPVLAQCDGGVCTFPAVGFPQATYFGMPKQDAIKSAMGRVKFIVDVKRPGTIDLWVDNTRVGSLDPWESTWTWEGYESQDLISFVGKENPPTRFREAKGKLLIQASSKEEAKIDYSKLESKIKAEEKAKGEGKPKAMVVESDDGCLGMDGCKLEVIDGSSPNERDRFRGNFGLIDKELKTQRYSIGGREVGPAEAMDALMGGSDSNLADDSQHLRITIIGNEVARKTVLRDFEQSPELAYWKGKVLINTYEPSNWRIRDGGFVTPKDPAKPVIYFQKPDGKVLWRQDSYEGGPSALAKALRDKDPLYDPNKDPQPNSPQPLMPSPVPSEGGFNVWWLLVLAAGGFVAFLWRKR